MSLIIHRLSPLEVGNAKVGMHADGGGLYLQVTRTAGGQLNKSRLFATPSADASARWDWAL